MNRVELIRIRCVRLWLWLCECGVGTRQHLCAHRTHRITAGHISSIEAGHFGPVSPPGSLCPRSGLTLVGLQRLISAICVPKQ